MAKAAQWFRTGRNCNNCKHWIRGTAIDDGTISGRCQIHECTMFGHEVCEHWNKGQTVATRPSTAKYHCRSMAKNVANQPLVQRARTIATKRGFQTESARWWEVLHTAHIQLCEAHQEGQAAGIRSVRDLIGRMAPVIEDGVRPSAEQLVEIELIERILAVIDRQQSTQPEIPSTGE